MYEDNFFNNDCLLISQNGLFFGRLFIYFYVKPAIRKAGENRDAACHDHS